MNPLCQVSISCMCAQDYGYGSVRSAVSVSSSGSAQKLENIDWNQQQGHRSETVSPEGQKPSEQVSVCHSLTAQHSKMSCLRKTQWPQKVERFDAQGSCYSIYLVLLLYIIPFSSLSYVWIISEKVMANIVFQWFAFFIPFHIFIVTAVRFYHTLSSLQN